MGDSPSLHGGALPPLPSGILQQADEHSCYTEAAVKEQPGSARGATVNPSAGEKQGCSSRLEPHRGRTARRDSMGLATHCLSCTTLPDARLGFQRTWNSQPPGWLIKEGTERIPGGADTSHSLPAPDKSMPC